MTAWYAPTTFISKVKFAKNVALSHPQMLQPNAWSHRDLFDAGNHFKGKEEILKHTQKHVNVLNATTISNKPRVWMSESDPLQKVN